MSGTEVDLEEPGAPASPAGSPILGLLHGRKLLSLLPDLVWLGSAAACSGNCQ